MSATAARIALSKALSDAIRLLERRKQDLSTWDEETEESFLAWFGTTDKAARTMISKRIDKALAKLRRLRARDFIAIAKPSHKGLTNRQFQDAIDDYNSTFAYVNPDTWYHGKYEHAVFVGPEFATADDVTRAGTLIHEVSHFVTVDQTDDVEATFPGDPRKPGPDRRMYGYTKATRLSMQSGDRVKSNKALKNADNFEFFIERHDPSDHPLDLDGAGDFPAMSGRIL